MQVYSSFYVQDHCKTDGFKELEPFLTSQQRTKPIQMDGNWAITEVLYGHEDDHERIRDTLVNYTLLNKDKFTPSTTESFDKHLQGMQMKGTWATHLEIFAAASLL